MLEHAKHWLIHPLAWSSLSYEGSSYAARSVPQEIRDAITGPPQVQGIGQSPKLGWFILRPASGKHNGMLTVFWQEKESS